MVPCSMFKPSLHCSREQRRRGWQMNGQEVVWRMRGERKVKEDLFMSVYDIGTEQHFFLDFYWS